MRLLFSICFFTCFVVQLRAQETRLYLERVSVTLEDSTDVINSIVIRADSNSIVYSAINEISKFSLKNDVSYDLLIQTAKQTYTIKDLNEYVQNNDLSYTLLVKIPFNSNPCVMGTYPLKDWSEGFHSQTLSSIENNIFLEPCIEVGVVKMELISGKYDLILGE